MRQIFSMALGVWLVFSPLNLLAQKKRVTAIKDKPLTARFIVQATLDENFKATKNAPQEKIAWNSHLHMEIQASRWLAMTKNEVGNTEFMPLEGGEPAAAAGNLKLDAISDSSTAETRVHDTVNFNGKLDADGARLTTPEFSELGEGLSFQILVSTKMLGGCHVKITGSDGKTIESSDCSDAPAAAAQGFTGYDENKETGKTAATASVASYTANFEIEPKLNLQQGNMTEETRRQLEESYRQQEQLMGAPKWFGAETRGNQQSGYKITFTGKKNLPVENADGEAKEWTQTLTVNAEIIPGAKTARFHSIDETPTINPFFSTLKEISEKQS